MMKILALLMIMANIVFFLWEYHIGALRPNTELQDSVSNELQPIFLASEVRQKLENKAIWEAEAVKERLPFVSDYFRTQIATGKVEAGNYRYLFNDPIIVPWYELIANAAMRIKEEPIPSKLITTESRHADAGEEQTLVKVEGPTSTSPKATAASKVDATPVQTAVDVIQGKPFESGPTNEANTLPAQSAGLNMCYEAGPFANHAQFEQWRRRAGIAAKFIKPIRREEQEVTGYLVYYPAPATFEQALANVEMLKKKGINDLWLFRKGESKGEISLGLFRNKNRAEVQAQELLGKGLEVSIRPRYKTADKVYAQMSIAQGYEDKLIVSRDWWRKRHPAFAIKAGGGCSVESAKPVAAEAGAKSQPKVDAIQGRPFESGPTNEANALPAQSAGLNMCYEAGPFANHAQFEQWRRRAGIAAKFIKPIRREEQEVTGYLVYYPAPATFEQALANVEMLKKKGINDLWLFRKGESKGEISLGLFRNKNRAEVQAQELLGKGLEVSIRPRYKTADKVYAQMSIAPGYEDKLIVSRDWWRKRHPEFAIRVGSDCAVKP